jgi:hypothetical protein
VNRKITSVFLLIGVLLLSSITIASAEINTDTHVENVGISGSPAVVSYNGYTVSIQVVLLRNFGITPSMEKQQLKINKYRLQI